MQKPACWARGLNDCDGPISAEHIISESVFGDGATIEVVGFPWCRTTPKRIPVRRLVANILCKHHNSLLSPVDSMAARAFHALNQAVAANQFRKNNPTSDWTVRWHIIDGAMLERWFVKTTINFSVASKSDRPWCIKHALEEIPIGLVRVAFGFQQPPNPAGLYSAFKEGTDFESIATVGHSPLFAANGCQAGATFNFRGFHFLLNATKYEPPQIRDESTGNLDVLWEKSELRRHLHRITVSVGDRLSFVIRFDWPEDPPQNCFVLGY